MDAVLKASQRFAGRLARRGVNVFGLANTVASTAASRWYLLLECMPQVAFSLAARFVLCDVFALEFFDSDTVAAFSNSAIFVIAIMLAGVLEDYKESEGIPADIAGHLDAVSQKIQFAAAMSTRAADARQDKEAEGEKAHRIDSKLLHQELLAFLEHIFEFTAGLRDDTDVLASLSLTAQYVASHVALAGDACTVEPGDVLQHFDEIRSLILRMHVIKRTDFLPSGYSLMELLVYVTMALTILAEYGGRGTAYATVGLAALQFFYVIALLRDIDDPFDYEPEKLLPLVMMEEEEEEGGEGEEEDEGEGAAKASRKGDDMPSVVKGGKDKQGSKGHERESGKQEAGKEGTEGKEGKPVVVMRGVGSSAEVDQYPLVNCYARLGRIAGLRLGRPAPPALRFDASGVPVRPSELLSPPSTNSNKRSITLPLGGSSSSVATSPSSSSASVPSGAHPVAAERHARQAEFKTALRASMLKSWVEADSLEGHL